jgi:hypothetical protein
MSTQISFFVQIAILFSEEKENFKKKDKNKIKKFRDNGIVLVIKNIFLLGVFIFGFALLCWILVFFFWLMITSNFYSKYEFSFPTKKYFLLPKQCRYL